MKNISFLKKAGCVALSLTMATGISAQNFCDFSRVGEQDESKADPMFPGTHRAAPVMMDYNNDGLLDIFYGGQNPDRGQVGDADNGWLPQSNLLKNNGDGTFTVLSEDKYTALPGTEVETASGITISTFSNVVFFDFNNDGYLDVLLTGRPEWGFNPMGDDSNYIVLYKNLGPDGDYKYELVNEALFRFGVPGDGKPNNEKQWMSMITVGDYDKDGYIDVATTGWNAGGGYGRWVDLYKNEGGTGEFTLQQVATTQGGVFISDEETNDFRPMSSGSVKFGDLDNDGWLDIVCSGYADGRYGDDPDPKAGNVLYIYKNMQDGTFNDITPEDVYGSWDGETILADFNADGLLDIFNVGHGDSWVRQANIIYNNGDGTFSLTGKDDLGLEGVQTSNIIAADLNNDGRIDLVYTGSGTDEIGGQEDKTRVVYQKADGTFVADDTYPIVHVEAGSSGIAVGDVDNDGALDIFVTGYNRSGIDGAYGCVARLYKNNLGDGIGANEAPSIPAGLIASITEGILNVSWEASTDNITPSDALSYNLYIKNNDTQKIFMLIAADIETGRLKVAKGLEVATFLTSYSMPLEDGNYTVGVQSIDQGQMSSEFAIARINSTAMPFVQKGQVTVLTTENGIVVKADNSQTVVVSDLCGRIIAKGETNANIPVVNRGVCLVTVDGVTYKIVK